MILNLCNKTHSAFRFLIQSLNSKKPCLAYIGSWKSPNNLGDYLLYYALIQLFHKFNFIEYPENYRLTAGILNKLFSLVDYGILSGGTLINRSERALKSAQNCFPFFKHSLVFGTGVADPAFWSNITWWKDSLPYWKKILENCSYVGVRGPISAQLLKDIGLKNVDIVGDPVLAFAYEKPDNIFNRKTLGLNIGKTWGSDKYRQLLWGSEQDLYKKILNLAMTAKKENWKVHWFVVTPADYEVTLKIAAESDTSEFIYPIYENYCNYLELVSKMSVFVGMKLHAVALAVCAYVPSIMLEYRPKCKDFMMSINQENANYRTDTFDFEEIWQNIVFFDKNRINESQLLFKSVQPLVKYQLKKSEEIIRLSQ